MVREPLADRFDIFGPIGSCLDEDLQGDGEIVVASDRGDHRVVGPDRCPGPFEIGTNAPVFLGAVIIERQARDRLEEGLEALEHPSRLSALAGSIQELRLDDRAHPDGRRRFVGEPLDHPGMAVVEHVNARVGVEQIHLRPSHRSTSSLGSSGGSTNPVPLQLPTTLRR